MEKIFFWKLKGFSLFKEGLLLIVLLSFVFLIHYPVVFSDLMYPEQPLLYSANQMLHSFRDLLMVYIQPKIFHLSILFFRPSGHFLLYQLLEPLLGWHNTRALILVNLGFLALSGYFILKLYNALFPQFKVGGYLALGYYLMHPALMLSRWIVLHFEFAYVFWTVLSLYCFVIFCKQGSRNFYLLAATLFFYVVAVTFKEPALLLGPVLFIYLLLSFYQGQTISVYVSEVYNNKKIKELLLLLGVVSLCLAIYLSLQWPTLKHPLRNDLNLPIVFSAFKILLLSAFGLKSLFFAAPVWRNVIFPPTSCFVLWSFCLLAAVGAALLFFNKTRIKQSRFEYKKSLIFLFLCSLIFLILPVFWGWGLPWHLSLSLLFLGLCMGFCLEYLCRYFIKSSSVVNMLCGFVALGVGLVGFQVNQVNIDYLMKEQGFPLSVGRNAVLNPPALKDKLNATSVLVVEDSRIHDAYLLGASLYPYPYTYRLNSRNLDADDQQYQQVQASMFLHQQPIYNGTLFKWAYLMPALQEEVYPFEVGHLEAVPDLILYNWLQHADDIFCVGYDEKAQWHDRSALFKKNLAREKKRRKMIVNHYERELAMAFEGQAAVVLPLAVPLPQLCQLSCDQNRQCQGFTYLESKKGNAKVNACLFYKSLAKRGKVSCAACEVYLKKSD